MRGAERGWGRVRMVLRVVLAVLFVVAGVNHFRSVGFYERIVPPFLPWAWGVVVISGVAEIVGGVGLMVGRLRRAAAVGLIVLLVAVFPANIYMAVRPELFADLGVAPWMLWARLPLQGVLIWWVWVVGLERAAGFDDEKLAAKGTKDTKGGI